MSESDTAADAVITAGLDGTITGWNPAAQLMFGYTEAEAVGSPVTMLMPDAFRHAHPAAMRRVRDGGSLRLANPAAASATASSAL